MSLSNQTYTRRGFLKSATFTAASMAMARPWLAKNASAGPGTRPNLLFLFTDDQRFDALGALNNPHVKTPHMDKLVRFGTTLTHGFIQGSTCGAVCVCSRAMLLTGRSLYRSPLQPGDDGLTLWPEAFRNEGYDTFGTGKWHNGRRAYARSFTHGGSIFFGGMCDHLRVPVYDFDPTGKYAAEKRYTGEGFSSTLFSNAAIDFIKSRKPGKPFLAYVSYTAPHDPRMAPKEYAEMYPPEKIPLPRNFMPEHPFDNGELRIRDERLAPWPRTPHIVREHIAAYYAMITHLDTQIGRVLKAIEQTAQADNTIIILAGDNGLAVGQHGLMGKQSLYEHSVRVPLVLAGPGIERGRRIDALCYLHDLFPTACELAGIPTPKSVESISLVPLLNGKQARIRPSVFAAYMRVQRMVRNERWKLILCPYAKRTQLFDLQNDPWETKDLSEEPEHAKLVQDLMADLERWQRQVGDPLDLDHLPPRTAAMAYRPGMPVSPARDGSFSLTPKAAKLHGRLCYQPNRNNLGAWFDYKDCPQWTLLDVRPGPYRVEFTYGSTNPGVPYTLVAGDKRLEGTTVHTGGIRTYRPFDIGTLELPKGKATLAIQPGKFKRPIMNFRLLRLLPVEQ